MNKRSKEDARGFGARERKKKRGTSDLVQRGSATRSSPRTKMAEGPEEPLHLTGEMQPVSPTEVQWKGLVLGEAPDGSRYPLCQVSMLDFRWAAGFDVEIPSHSS